MKEGFEYVGGIMACTECGDEFRALDAEWHECEGCGNKVKIIKIKTAPDNTLEELAYVPDWIKEELEGD